MPMKLPRIFHRRHHHRHHRMNKEDHESTSTTKKGNLLKRLSTHLTLKPSFGDEEGEGGEQPQHHSSSHTLDDSGLLHNHCRGCQRKLYQVVELSSSSGVSFEEQFESIQPSKKERALVLLNFVETSTRHDIYALVNLLDNKEHLWKKVQLVDTVPVGTCRRWRYKKDNILHHIKDICKERDITMMFDDTMELNMDKMSTFKAAMGALQQIETDNEIIQLTLCGHLDDQQADAVLEQIMSVLSKEDRIWEQVRIEITFGGRDPRQYQYWHQTMERYRLLLGQMQLQYGIPITMVRPYSQ